MKKLWVIAGSVLLFFSCASMFKGTVWDPSIPPEECAKICFIQFEPTGYNGINVDKKAFALVNIPAGTAQFSGNINWGYWYYIGNRRYTYSFKKEDVIFSCALEAGKEYWAFISTRKENENDKENENIIWGIDLYEAEIKVIVGTPGSDKLIAFIPFEPPVITSAF